MIEGEFLILFPSLSWVFAVLSCHHGQERSSHNLRTSQVAEFAFTGDTTRDFMNDPANDPVFSARVLVMELTFLDDKISPEQARVRNTAPNGCS